MNNIEGNAAGKLTQNLLTIDTPQYGALGTDELIVVAFAYTAAPHPANRMARRIAQRIENAFRCMKPRLADDEFPLKFQGHAIGWDGAFIAQRFADKMPCKNFSHKIVSQMRRRW